MEESYIVRIYQRQADHVTGVVELIDREERYAFRDATELWAILSKAAGRHDVKEPATVTLMRPYLQTNENTASQSNIPGKMGGIEK